MNVGVVVARFQVDTLHDGHQLLLKAVADDNDAVIIVLGVNETRNTMENPLDFETRKLMVKGVLPDAVVLPLPDHPDDAIWSRQLDALLSAQTIPASGTMTLYGSRDSFIDAYQGEFTTCVLNTAVGHLSGTTVRAAIGREPRASDDFRAGAIYASQNRYPAVFTTVDVLTFHPDQDLCLLGRKAGHTQWCLIGGFADPTSPSFEVDAARELLEETHILVLAKDLVYVGSMVIDDWRYRKGPDRIKTLLFVAHPKNTLSARADDDLEDIAWFSYSHAIREIHPIHKPLLERAFEHYGIETT